MSGDTCMFIKRGDMCTCIANVESIKRKDRMHTHSLGEQGPVNLHPILYSTLAVPVPDELLDLASRLSTLCAVGEPRLPRIRARLGILAILGFTHRLGELATRIAPLVAGYGACVSVCECV